MSETKDLAVIPEATDVIVIGGTPKNDVIVGRTPTQQVVLVEAYVAQGIPGAPGSNIPPPTAADIGKAAVVMDLGSGPLWTKGNDFRPQIVSAGELRAGPQGRAGISVDAPGASAQVTLDASSGGTGTGWRLQWATGLLSWMVAGVARVTIAADGAVSFLKGLFTGTVVINTTGGAVPAAIAGDTLIAGYATGQARVELNCFGGPPLYMGRGARGTGAAPAPLLAGDPLVVVQGRGWGATGYSLTGRAAININATENWTDAAQGAGITFATGPNGSIGQPAARWTVQHDGHFVPIVHNVVDVGASATHARDGWLAGALTISRAPANGRPAAVNAETAIHLVSGAPSVQMESFAGASLIFARRANGGYGAPTATKLNDPILVLTGGGYGATGWGQPTGSGLVVQAAENWTDAAQGSFLYLQTTPKGSATPLTRWLLTDAGHLIPNLSNTFDIGSAVTGGPRVGYFGTRINVDLTNTAMRALPAALFYGAGAATTQACCQLDVFQNSPGFMGRAAMGTPAAPTAAILGLALVQLDGRGYGATGYSTARGIVDVVASENWTDAAQGAGVRIATTPPGTTALTYRWQFTDTGHLYPMANAAFDIGGAPNSQVRSGYFSASVVVDQTGGSIAAPLVGGAQLRACSTAGNWTVVDLINYGGVAAITGRRSGGNAVAPLAIGVSIPLLQMEGRGWDGAGWTGPAATITYASTEAWTAASHGANILFGSTPKGSLTAVSSWQLADTGAFSPLQDKAFDIGMGATARVRTVYADAFVGGNNQVVLGHTGGGNDSGFLKLNVAGNDYFMADAGTRDLTWNVGAVPKFVLRQSGKMEVIGPATINGDLVATGIGYVGNTSEMMLRANTADANSVITFRNSAATYWIFDWVGKAMSWVVDGVAKFQVQSSGDIMLWRNIKWSSDASQAAIRPAPNALLDIVTGNESRFADIRARVFANAASTVAGLPPAPLGGSHAFVTDATANTFGAVVVGGGPYSVPVFHDGGGWKVG